METSWACADAINAPGRPYNTPLCDKFRLTASLDTTRRKTRAYLGIYNCNRTHLHPTVSAEQLPLQTEGSSETLYKTAAATLSLPRYVRGPRLCGYMYRYVTMVGIYGAS